MRGILIATPATSIGPRQHLLRSLLSLALAFGMTSIYITRIQGLQYIYTLRTRASQGNVIIASEFVFFSFIRYQTISRTHADFSNLTAHKNIYICQIFYHLQLFIVKRGIEVTVCVFHLLFFLNELKKNVPFYPTQLTNCREFSNDIPNAA